jgi:hypothetical protein
MRERFDQDAIPSVLFQQPGLGAGGWLIRTDIDEKTGGSSVKELPHQFVFRRMSIHVRAKQPSSQRPGVQNANLAF